MNFLPDYRREVMNRRVALCETMAVNSSLLASLKQPKALDFSLRELRERNDDILSAAMRRNDGKVIVVTGDHEVNWDASEDGKSTENDITVPIMEGAKQWGNLEVAFVPYESESVLGAIDLPWLQLIVFVSGMNAIFFSFYLRRALRELDPSRVMPDRVRSAFDTLAEGLLVIDHQGKIVLANRAFAEVMDCRPEALIGQPAASLPWVENKSQPVPPWELALADQMSHEGMQMTLQSPTRSTRTFKVNASPIIDQSGSHRGVLTSFDDITLLEQKRMEMVKMVETLRESRDQITQQNTELKYLATRDPLTGCFNRRSFFEQFDHIWESSEANADGLCCMMVDVDHFKSINDNHGHSMGDDVLRRVASTLLSVASDVGIVCRYGGEEFCILMPNMSLDDARTVAETVRTSIAALQFPQLTITVSSGVSTRDGTVHSPQDLLDQADKALYYSKETGRNRVTAWCDVPLDFKVEKKKERKLPASYEAAAAQAVPYQAVASLMAALAYRDPDTAAHSTRVADLCVTAARGLMSAGEAYLLEIAALLHDIGKIGVPDSILLKPGKLSAEEWDIMHLHARMGVEILNTAFQCPPLVEMVQLYDQLYGGDPLDPSRPKGDDLPVGARLIKIADAYDAMTTDRVYRKGRPPEEAFAELRRTAGKQFDPELVERFIEAVSQRPAQDAARQQVSKDLALNLGLQTERLAKAMDSQDFKAIKALAMHLEATARNHGLVEIEKAVQELQQLCVSDPDVPRLVQIIHDLISLSLSTQHAYLKMDDDLISAVNARQKQLAHSESQRR